MKYSPDPRQPVVVEISCYAAQLSSLEHLCEVARAKGATAESTVTVDGRTITVKRVVEDTE